MGGAYGRRSKAELSCVALSDGAARALGHHPHTLYGNKATALTA